MIEKRVKLLNHSVKFDGFSLPGDTRQLSIYNCLKDIGMGQAEDLVIVHDAARPNLNNSLLGNIIEASKGHDGVMPVLPMKDTVYICNKNRRVAHLLDRNLVFAGQAPELFNLNKYIKANEAILQDKMKKINGATEPAILAGMDIVTVLGDENNYKITTKRDLEEFIAGLSRKD